MLTIPGRRKIVLELIERLHGKGATVVCVRVPADWSNFFRKHREVLNISLDPPETKRILLKTKKFVNASFKLALPQYLGALAGYSDHREFQCGSPSRRDLSAR